MKRLSRAGSIAVATGTAAVLLGAGVAVAFWSTSGTAAGEAVAGEAANVSIVQTSTTDGLYPAGPAVPITIDITNPNDFPVTLASVGVAVAGTTPATCLADDFTVSGLAYTGGVIPADSTISATSTATIAMEESGIDQNACQGATIDLAFTAVAG